MAYIKTEQPRSSDSITNNLQWVPAPGGPGSSENTSLGLSYLTQIDTLSVQQEPSMMQIVTGLSSAQRFRVLDGQGQLVFYAAENDSDACHRWCCGPKRAFVIHIIDQTNQEVIRISREFKCCVGCCWCACTDCCAHEVFVESPPGVHVGTIRQMRSFWRDHLSLKDADGYEQLHVIGPFCICQGVCCCCCENKFTMYATDRQTELGAIYKEYAGFVNQAFTGAEKYTIKFPANIPVQMKAVAMGALFLVNFMHFAGNAESKGGSNLSLFG